MAAADLRAGQAPATPAPPTGRAIELLLLAFATVLVTAALILVEANADHSGQGFDPVLLYVGAGYLGLFTVAHLAVRRFAPYADPLILPCIALLNGLGLVMIHRLDLTKLDKVLPGKRPPPELVNKQLVLTAVGVMLFIAVLVAVRDHRTLSRYTYTAGFAGLFLLALPGLLPDSISSVNGAKIWLILFGFSIQPGEFAKILLIVFFAGFLVQKRDLFTNAGRRFLGMELPRARDLAPLLVAWGLSIAVLLVEKDLGSSLLIFGIILVLIYVATERVSWLLIGLVSFFGGAALAYPLFTHVQTRVLNWLDPYRDPLKSTFQPLQALFGLGTGGVGGTGLGAGHPDIVPEAESDYIAASLGEELGLIGLAAILVVYLLLITRGLRSALAVRDSFGKLLATGLSFAVALQIFVVIGGVSNLLPLTGLTLPFLSYGGSSLLANYILVALLLRVSNAARAPIPRRAAPQVPIADAGTALVERPK